MTLRDKILSSRIPYTFTHIFISTYTYVCTV